MSYPAISLATATAGRHRRPPKRLQTAANLPSTRIRARIIAPVTPSPPSAVLTPSIPVHRWIRAKEAGEFQINYRFWLCGNSYEECDRRPRPEHSDEQDQQLWAVFVDTVNVTNPVTATGDFARNSAEDFDTLDAADNESPTGIWSDGTTMWVADDSDGKLYAYGLDTKARDSSKDFDTLDAAGNDSPTGIWSDGTTMWVADDSDDEIYAYNVSTKARDSSKDFDTPDSAGNERPTGIWSDETTMWVADSSDDKIYAYNMSTKARDSSKDFDTLEDAENERPEGIWSDGETMWVADYSDDKIYAYSMSTKARVSSKDFDTLEDADNEHTYGIWSDGETMWVADGSDDKIYAYNAPETAVSGTSGAPTVSRVPSSPSQVSLFTGDSHTFTASATDLDRDLKSYSFSVNGSEERSGGVSLNPFASVGESTKSFSHTFSTAGTYTVEATFTDKDDLSGSVSWSVTVTDNRAPTVAGTPSTQQTLSLTTGDSQTFGVSATDPDGNMTKWEWEVDKHASLFHGHQEPEETFTATGNITRSFSHTFPDDGTYTVEATFTDSRGESGSAEWTVTVEDPPNRIPSLTRVSPGPSDYVPTGEVTFVASVDDPDDNLKRYEWSVNGTSEEDGSWLLLLPTGTVTKSFTHTFATAGVYTVQVVFTDDEGLSAAIRWRITVVDPVTVQLGAATYAVNEDDGEVDVTVTISASPYRLLPLRLTTSDGTAESVSDYGSLSNRSVSFLSGTTTLTQTFTVPITDNSYVEPTEAFTVELEPGVGGLPPHMSLTRSEATVTIHDDDQATVQFSREGFTLSESSLTFQSVVEVESDTPSSCPVDAPFGVDLSHIAPDGTSSSGPSVPSSVTFQHCQRARDFRVDMQDLSGTGPGVLTGTTEVVFTLDGVGSASPGVVSRVRIGEISTQTVTIQDNDEVTLRFKNTYIIKREREQFDICVVKAAYPSVRIARPFTAHFSYSDPDGALSTGSTVPLSVTLDAGDTEGCGTVHVGDVGQTGASVSFTLDRVTSTGSDVASRVVISGSASEMEVSVEDRDGLASSVAVTVDSDPSGLTVTVDGTDTTTPYTANWTSGSSHTLDAPSPQTVNQNVYVFSGWSDGLDQSHSVSPTADTTYTANFALTSSGGTPTAEITSCGASPANPTVRNEWKPVAVVTNHSYTSRLSKEFYVKFTISDPTRGLELPETESTTKTWIQIGDSYTFEGPAASWPEDEKEQRAETGSHQLPLFPLKWFPGEIVVDCELKAKDFLPGDELIDEDTGTVTIPNFQRGSADAEITEPDGETTCAPARRPVLSGEAPTLEAKTKHLGNYKDLKRFAIEYWVHHEGLRVHHSGEDVTPDSSFDNQKNSSSKWGTEEGWERPEDRIDLDSGDLPLGTYTLDCALWGHKTFGSAYKRLRASNAAYELFLDFYKVGTNPIGTIIEQLVGEISPRAEVARLEREFTRWTDDEDYSLQGIVSTEFTVVEARWGMDGLSIERGIETPPDGKERIRVRINREETKYRVGGRIPAPYFHIAGPELDQLEEATLCQSGGQDHTRYLSRCWEKTFDIPVNDTKDPREYTVKTRSFFILNEQEVSFTVEASPDAAGLEAFYNATGGPSWVNKDGWLSSAPIGDWYGVTTDANGRVEGLDFRGSDRRGNGLQGAIPFDLKDKLPSLKALYLEGNSGLTRCIPENLFTLTNDFEEIGLPNCAETCAWGEALPDPGNSGLVADCEALLAALNSLTAGANSRVLNWSTRTPIGEWRGVGLGGSPERVIILEITMPPRLWGFLSAELGKLSKLEILNLSINGLQGKLPDEVEDLTSLHTLNLSSNQLDGRIPVELTRLTNLRNLDLSENKLNGRIPENLANLANLQSLNLRDNLFTGCIPQGLRRVAVNDLDDLELPFCDVLLSGLTIGAGTLTPQFSPAHTEYVAEVRSSPVTITPTNDHNAQFAFLDENDVPIPDADGAMAGHQVALDESATTIKVRVTSSADGNSTHTYSIAVSLVGLPGAPAITGPITSGTASLTVSWTMPGETGGTAITSYDLRYIESSATDKADANWSVVEGAWSTGQLTYTAFGLDSGTQYDVQVRAVTKVGPGPWSATSTGSPSAGGCSSGGAVEVAANKPGLVADCEVLLAAQDTLAGTASLNWLASTSIGDWDGVTVGGTPQRVTGLDLANRQLTGSIAVALGSLTELQSLLLSNNQLTGNIPGELARLSNLRSLTLSQNQLAGCIPEDLRDVASNDLASVGLPFCDVMLSGLTITPGTLTPQFEPGRADYTADVEPSQTTITPTNDHNAAFQFLDEYDAAIQDADVAVVGQQVELGYGITTIKIRVISQDTEATHTYTIEVSRVGMPGVSEIAGLITPGAQSLTVEWSAPANDGGTAITGYDLRFIRNDAPDKADGNWTVRSGIWSSGDLRYDLQGLTNGVAYDLQVRAVNSTGDGPWSATAIGTPSSETADASRAFSSVSVDPGEELTVTIAGAGSGAAQVVETLPTGFSYVSSSLSPDSVVVASPTVTFTLLGNDSFTYIVTASSVEGDYSFLGVWSPLGGEGLPIGGASTVTVGSFPTVELSIDDDMPLEIRIGSPVPVIATFSEVVSGFTVDDITVMKGTVGNFREDTQGIVYAFDVTPEDIAEVIVDIAAGVAMDGEGNGNTAAAPLSFTPYDDDGEAGISKGEAIAAIRDYFEGNLTKAQAIAVIRLYFTSGS